MINRVTVTLWFYSCDVCGFSTKPDTSKTKPVDKLIFEEKGKHYCQNCWRDYWQKKAENWGKTTEIL